MYPNVFPRNISQMHSVNHQTSFLEVLLPESILQSCNSSAFTSDARNSLVLPQISVMLISLLYQHINDFPPHEALLVLRGLLVSTSVSFTWEITYMTPAFRNCTQMWSHLPLEQKIAINTLTIQRTEASHSSAFSAPF